MTRPLIRQYEELGGELDDCKIIRFADKDKLWDYIEENWDYTKDNFKDPRKIRIIDPVKSLVIVREGTC